MMAILTFIRERYERFLLQKRRLAWDNDLKVLLKTHDDPYNFEGLELVLLHLRLNSPKDLNTTQRRTNLVATSTKSIDQLLSLISGARLFVIGRDTMPKDFFPSEASRVRRFDDYFVSDAGHIVSIEKIYPSLEGWINQLITTIRELEADESNQYAYYNRKLRGLYHDSFNVLHAILRSQF